MITPNGVAAKRHNIGEWVVEIRPSGDDVSYSVWIVGDKSYTQRDKYRMHKDPDWCIGSIWWVPQGRMHWLASPRRFKATGAFVEFNDAVKHLVSQLTSTPRHLRKHEEQVL